MVIEGRIQVLDRDKAGALRGFICLEDVSEADAPSRVIARAALDLAEGAAQARFRIMLNAAPDAQRHYAVTARLEGAATTSGGSLVFGTTVAYPWNPSVRSELAVEVRPWT